jgi:hypothetical protein
MGRMGRMGRTGRMGGTGRIGRIRQDVRMGNTTRSKTNVMAGDAGHDRPSENPAKDAALRVLGGD